MRRGAILLILILLDCDKQSPWVASLQITSLPPHLISHFPSPFHFPCLLPFLSQHQLYFDVYSRQHHFLKDRQDNILAGKAAQYMLVMSHVLPFPPELSTLHLLQRHFFHCQLCSALHIFLTVPIVIFHVLSPLFPLCSAASDLHFLFFCRPCLPLFSLLSSACSFFVLPFPLLICCYSIFSSLLCKISDPAV